MGRDEYLHDENLIHNFCAIRGHGEETKQYLLGCAKERNKSFDKLKKGGDLNEEHRYSPLTEQHLEKWLENMDINPLFCQ